MYTYPRYLVKDTDQFDSYNFPAIENDIENIIASTAHLPADYKHQMLISSIKNNEMHADWVLANPLLANIISSGDLPLSNIGSLFDCSKNNPAFTDQMSEYLVTKFS